LQEAQEECARLRAELTNEREVAADVETDYGQEMDALRVERDEARADARRYRWLRDNRAAGKPTVNLFINGTIPSDMNAAIDAALKGDAK